MIEHYLASAIRACRRAPWATVVNVFTLALGLGCFVVAYAVADYLRSADRQFANADRTLVVTTRYREREGTFDSGIRPLSNRWLAEYLEADFPQLPAVARVVLPKKNAAEDIAVHSGDRSVRFRGLVADAAFLDIFDLPFLAGDPRAALRTPGSVVLTKQAAQKLYGTEDALGRAVLVDNAIEGTVTGVIDAIRGPSHLGGSSFAPLRFDMLLSADFADAMYYQQFGRQLAQEPENWVNGTDTTYVLLPKDGSLTRADLRRQLPAFAARHVPEQQLRDFDLDFDLIPVGNLLPMALSAALLPRQSGLSVDVIAVVLGVLVLGVACANFVNLATARAAVRAREIGVRKTLGATARQIAAQYLAEVAVLALAALAVALALVAAAIPAADRLLDMQLGSLLIDSTPWAALLLLVVAVIVVAGAYPALLLSRIGPMSALRVGHSRSGPRFLGTWLAGAQFAVVAFLLVAVAVVYSQNRELERTALELSSDPLLVIENDPRVTGVSQPTLREELLRLPGVVSASLMEQPPWTDPHAVLPFRTVPSPSAPQSAALVYLVGEDFFKTLGLRLLAGRPFGSQRSGDVAAVGRPPTGTQSVIISHALAEELGAASPGEILGRQIYNPAGFAYQVIGVVENSVLSISASAGPRPRIFLFNPADLDFHVVRLSARDVSGTVAAVDALWKRLAPNVAIKRRFADDYFNDSYAAFARINQAFTAFAVLAVAIAAIGLAAMALSVTNRRRGEIGVRKILGGSAAQMTLMLLAAFGRPVAAANLIAWPFAYAAAHAYLAIFIDPIELSVMPFVGSLIATLLIGGIAVARQTLGAARLRPATVLRHE
ncbi:MAG TPA: ABC transporter permease [Gammaproteobacteria bacterium]|nr:ABC transporter permease [Gammaproteobacteria bacterium]